MSNNPSDPTSLLIADVGSTKGDWIMVSGDERRRFRSRGINPYFQDETEVKRVLEEDLDAELFQLETRVHYYGAGCSSDLHKGRVKGALKRLFPEAFVEVEHDLLGAARAVSGREPGLVAILGTGSNACSYDGERIVEQSGGLGYILGDEGSGAHLGKKLLRDHLNGDLPKGLEIAFRERFPQKREEFIEAVHRGEAPSRYLASFAPFLKEHEGNEWVAHTVREAFGEFLDRHVLRFRGAKGSLLHSVGSIGYHFHSFLLEELEARGMHEGHFITDVVEALVRFHRSAT